ncbi:hypothetical protein HPOKI112_03195 [Helicobacter pylori oki112]|nr:hypothetical protein HPOKI112_03195 [Helicobacter pylori oki112]
MEKVLAFFILSFFISGFFWGGGVTYKPTLNLLESPKFLAFFKSHLLTPLKRG